MFLYYISILTNGNVPASEHPVSIHRHTHTLLMDLASVLHLQRSPGLTRPHTPRPSLPPLTSRLSAGAINYPCAVHWLCLQREAEVLMKYSGISILKFPGGRSMGLGKTALWYRVRGLQALAPVPTLLESGAGRLGRWGKGFRTVLSCASGWCPLGWEVCAAVRRGYRF